MGRYQADPDNSEKSGLKALPREAFGQVTAPAEQVIQKSPWYVLVNNSGSYKKEFSSLLSPKVEFSIILYT